ILSNANISYASSSTSTIPSSLSALAFATSLTGFPILNMDGANNRLGIGTSTPAERLSINGNIILSGGQFTYASSSTSTVPNSAHNVWSISTSTTITPILSISTLTPTGAKDIASSTVVGRVGIGTTTPEARLSIDGRTAAHIGIAGIHEVLTVAPTGGNSLQHGNRMIITNSPTGSATNTLLGELIRIFDDTTVQNIVRGMEIQPHRGTNSAGINTGILAFGKTFGLQGVTTADAAGSVVPAGVFAENQGTSTGQALRVYTGTSTTADLAEFYQDGTQNFSGAGLRMNFQRGTGNFLGSFLDFQVNGVTRILATTTGTIGIGTSTPLIQASTTQRGLHIHTGNMVGESTVTPMVLLDMDDLATTHRHFMTGRSDIDGTSDIEFTINSDGNFISDGTFSSAGADVAEWFPAKDTKATLEEGDVVIVDGSSPSNLVKKSEGNVYDRRVLGIISTKPGLISGGGSVEDSHTDDVIVALAGRVPLKVSTEGGSIQPGDRLTSSSIPGVAMKATTSGFTVGVALEAYDGSGFLSEGVVGVHTQKITAESIATTTRLVLRDKSDHSGRTDMTDESDEKYGLPSAVLSRGGQNFEWVTVEEEKRTTDIIEKVPDRGLAKEETAAGGETVKIGKILTFVNLAWTQLDDTAMRLAVATSSAIFGPDNAWSVDQSTGKVNVGFYGDIDLHGNNIVNVASVISENGKWRIGADGTLVVEEIQAKRGSFSEKLEVGKPTQPTGITLYDEVTGEPYCVRMMNGSLQPTSGACRAYNPDNGAPLGATDSSTSASGAASADTTAGSTAVDTAVTTDNSTNTNAGGDTATTDTSASADTGTGSGNNTSTTSIDNITTGAGTDSGGAATTDTGAGTDANATGTGGDSTNNSIQSSNGVGETTTGANGSAATDSGSAGTADTTTSAADTTASSEAAAASTADTAI
ncbi:MAG: hypothetical protein AAB539_02775, partial [Patescibacteria group bacterium]